MRAVCYVCDKPAAFCICKSVPRVANRTHVTVLQHPRERRHPVGTARLLRLGLTRFDLQVCWDLTVAPRHGEGLGLLYPSPHAQNLSTCPATERPRELIALDGTWSQAKGLYRANPWLRALPHYRIDPDGTDRYRIRKEPRADYTSTLEAVTQALMLLESDTAGLHELVRAFAAMIDRQVGVIEETRAGGRRLARPRRRRPVPTPLWQEASRVVVVYGETRRTSPKQLAEGDPADIVYWTGYRPATGAVFAETVATRAPLEPSYHRHLGLAPELLAAARPLSEVRARWAAFCGQEPIFVAWNRSTLVALSQLVDNEPPGVQLKGVFCNWLRGPCRQLELELAARRVPVPAIPGVHGRAATRLAAAAAMLSFLVERGKLLESA